MVRGVNWLGDAIMTTPAIQRLGQHLPNARIALLTQENLAELWQDHPALHDVLTFKRGENPWSVARRLRAQRFQTALILPNSPRSALEAWLAGIPHRIGYSGRWRGCFLTQPVRHLERYKSLRKRGIGEVKRLIRQNTSHGIANPAHPVRHQINDYLYLSAALGADPTPVAPRLQVSSQEVESAASLVQQLSTAAHLASGEPHLWIGLYASAAYGPAKRWPLERFSEVIRQISTRIPGCSWLCLGTQSDWELNEQLAKSANGRVLNLAGRTSLRQLMAVSKCCRLVLTNDSGPMHLAAAVGTPVVVPFGSTSPELTGPGEPGDGRHSILRSHVPCAPCFRRTCPIDLRCMTGIRAEQVVAAVVRTLGEQTA